MGKPRGFLEIRRSKGAQRPIGEDGRPLVRALEIAVSVADRKDVERTAGTEFHDRRERKRVHQLVNCVAVTPLVRCRHDAG